MAKAEDNCELGKWLVKLELNENETIMVSLRYDGEAVSEGWWSPIKREEGLRGGVDI